VLATEHEARHLSAHDFRHAALTHMAAVGSDLTAIGHVAGHKNATTTALYVHNSEAAARRAVARRAGILDTKVDTEPDQARNRLEPRTEMADRFRGVVRGGLGGEELAERTHVREQAPQPASRQRAADRKRDAASGGPSWTRTRSQWIKNAATYGE